jgi:nucleoside-diphosphate-sugar epimerase
VSRFLVTGGTGFIGSAIVRRLNADGHDVVAPSSRELDLLGANDGDLARIIGVAAASHCIHCAWFTNHADYLVHDVNREWLAASRRLADAFPGRFVGLGTCLEYDVGNADGPLAEDAPLGPETLYARCKQELFKTLAASGRDFAWARVFFVYGPGDRDGRLIPTMIEKFSHGEAAGPTCGGLRRDYVHVDDLAGQLVRIALSEVQGAVNTGTGDAPTLSEIFEAGARALGGPELALRNDETGGQPPLIRADLTHFRREIGDPAARDIATGLGDLVR